MKKYNKIFTLLLITILSMPFKVFAAPAANCDTMLSGIKPDLQNMFKIMKIIGPLAVFALSVYEYAGAIFSKDAEGLKKCNNHLKTRFILVVILILLPSIIDLMLGLIDPGYSTCNIG